MSEKDCSKNNLFILTIGQLCSVFCTFMFDFAISLFVLDIGNTNTQYSVVIVFGMVSRIIINLFGGVFVDRYNKKKILVGCDLISGIIVTFALVLCMKDNFTYAGIMIITVLLNAANSMFGLSFMSAVPNLFKGEKMLMAGNSISQTIQAVSAVLGPVIGSILYLKYGIKLIIIINLISFFGTGILEMFLTYEGKKEEHENYLTSLKQGYQYIGRHSNLKNLCIFYALFQTILAPLLSVLLPLVVYVELELSSVSLGAIQAAYAVGVLVGASLASAKKDNMIILKNFFKYIRLEGLFIILWFVLGIPFVVSLGAIPKTIIFSVIVLVLSTVNMFLTIPLITYFQSSITENMRGKLFGVITTALTIGTPLGGMILGGLSDSVNWMILVILSGIVLIILSLLFSKKINFSTEE